jgi:hypothetical protein
MDRTRDPKEGKAPSVNHPPTLFVRFQAAANLMPLFAGALGVGDIFCRE